MKMREPTKCDHVLRALWRAQRFALDVLIMTFCTAISMTISLSYFSAKFSSIWSWIKGHLKSRAYGLVFPAVSVDDVLEQGVRQLPAHVAKTLEMNLIDFENWDCLFFFIEIVLPSAIFHSQAWQRWSTPGRKSLVFFQHTCCKPAEFELDIEEQLFCTPQAPCRSPRTWASSWWTPRSASSPARRSESQTCQGCPACGYNEVHPLCDQYASVGKRKNKETLL